MRPRDKYGIPVLVVVLLALISWGIVTAGRQAGYCGRAHAVLPRGVMTDAEWKCVKTGTPLFVMKTLYGVTPTRDNTLLLWHSPDGTRAYTAIFTCNDDEALFENGLCGTGGWTLTKKEEYIK